MKGPLWTQDEIATLRALYPKGGASACRKRIERTERAIYEKADKLGVARLGLKPRSPNYRNDPWTDEMIREAAASKRNGAFKAVADRIGRPATWVSRRALKLDLRCSRRRMPAWSEDELQLLAETAHLTPKSASQRFSRDGYTRSEVAIAGQRSRMRVTMDETGHYTARQVAALFGVEGGTIGRWIRLHGLRAKPRGTERKPQQGGDEWLITERAVREFIADNPLRIELHKIPVAHQAWFVQLLVGRGPSAQRERDAA